ncbi:MAG: Nif3-like dinuclear metal center hexameric protein, partial [Flavobacterium sp.]
MTIQSLLPLLENMAPTSYAEDFDNVGLLTGNPQHEITGILVCHDALENVIQEAIDTKCNVVVCFHPIVFSGLKKITGSNYVEKAIILAIKHDIAIYAVHTGLDNHPDGVNKIMCKALGIENSKVLLPKENYIKKLVTFTIPENFETLRNALFEAGAGNIGNYEDCSFSSKGIGTYMGNESSNPEIGERYEFVENEEIKIEVTFEKHLESSILKALFNHHVYEEVAYEIYELKNKHQNIGLGHIGSLPKPMTEENFLKHVKDRLECGIIRHSTLLGKPIERVAVLGGSGSFAIKAAIRAKA